MSGWLVISHLGAAMLGCVVGVLVMALCAASGAASRMEEAAGAEPERRDELGVGS